MKRVFGLTAICFCSLMFILACSKDPISETLPQKASINGPYAINSNNTVNNSPKPILVNNRNLHNFPSTPVSIYNNDLLFNVSLIRLEGPEAKELVNNNSNVKTIYFIENLTSGNADFFPVSDIIPPDNSNVILRKEKVIFNSGFTPHQFYSASEILQAASLPNPEINIVLDGDAFMTVADGPVK